MAALSRNKEQLAIEPLEAVLKGMAVELWSDAAGGRFWLVADEGDATTVAEPRGTVYTLRKRG